MNGWLVMARCAIDEIPMRLFTERMTALDSAKHTKRDEVLRQAGRFRLDTSIIFGIDILEFKNGLPQSYEYVVDFDEVTE